MTPTMDEISYVSAEAAALAKEWEGRFARLPPDAGVIFASVQAKRVERGLVHSFGVVLGIAPQFTESLGIALAKNVLADMLPNYTFYFQVTRGIACAAHPGVDQR